MNKAKKAITLLSAISLLSCVACSGEKNEANGTFTDPVPTQPTTVKTTVAVTTAAPVTATELTTTSTEKPTEAPTEPVTTKKEAKAYDSGMYKVGKDIPEGEYILFNTSDRSAYMCVSSDANGNDITFNENFESDLIITVYEDEYLELSRCIAVDLDELTEGSEDKAKNILDVLPNGIEQGAMYKVGLMLEPGEYRLENTGDRSAYYCIYSDSRHDDIIANDNFDTNAYVNVADGEYLLLSRCKIVK